MPPISRYSGYTPCRCRDCFEIAVSYNMLDPDFCKDCVQAGCEDNKECKAEGAYGGEDARGGNQ